MGPDVGSQEQWKFPNMKRNPLTKLEKKMIVAEVTKKSVLAIFKTHTYRFANIFFLQRKGRPIGLRSACCIALLVMLWWDEEFLEVLKKNNLAIIRGASYMDDVRVWLRAIRLGWRWQNGRAQFRKEWRAEEMAAGMTLLQKTSEVLEGP
jgi:hypothetical protein